MIATRTATKTEVPRTKAVRLPTRCYTAIVERAERDGVSYSTILRDAVDALVERDAETAAKQPRVGDEARQ